HDTVRRNLEFASERLTRGGEADGLTLRRGNRDVCDTFLGRRIIKNELQTICGELPGVRRIQQIQIDEQKLAVVHTAQSFKHQVHPQAFAGAVNFLADVAGLSSKLEGAEIFEGNKSHG